MKVKNLRDNSFYRNAVYLIANAIVSSASGFIFWVLAARFYSTAEVGLVSGLIAAMTLINSLALLGFNIGLLRYLPNSPQKNEVINSTLSLVIVAASTLAIFFIIGIQIWSPSLEFIQKELKYFMPFLIFTIATSVFIIQNQIFVSLRQSGMSLAQQLILQIVRILSVFLLIPLGIFGLLSSWGVGAFVAIIVGNFVLLKGVMPNYSFKLSVNRKPISHILHYSLINYLSEVLSSLPIYLLPLLIVNILGPEPSAYFRIGFGMSSVIFAIRGAIFLSMFAEGSNEPLKLREYALKATKLSLITLMPIIIIMVLFGKYILLIFGTTYSQNSTQVLWFFTISVLPMAIIELFVTINRIQHNMKSVIYILGLLSVTVLLFCIILMEYFGLLGVSIGWLVGYTITGFFATRGLLKLLSKKGNPLLI